MARFRLIVVILFCCGLVSACGTSTPASTNTQTGVPSASDEHAGHGNSANNDASYDATFIDGMIEHHEGAIAMAKEVLSQSERPELLAMADEIIVAQAAEVEQMLAWRAAWFPDLAPTTGMAMDMGEMSISTDESIPFDQRFLVAMISHHEGALHMAEDALAHSEREEIRELAAVIIAAQSAEIEQMRDWLQEWFGVSE